MLNNECNGAPAYQDPNNTMNNDPTNPTDYPTGSSRGTQVNAAELELFVRSAA